MKNKVLMGLLVVLVGLNIGIIILLGRSNNKCKCDIDNDKLEEIKINEAYQNMSNKLIEYVKDIYKIEEKGVEAFEVGIYEVSIKEMEEKGYDISMFVNPVNGEVCDKEFTKGKLLVYGKKDNDDIEFTYSTDISCEVNYGEEK